MKINGVMLKGMLASAISLACASALAGEVSIGSATAPVGGGATSPAAIAINYTPGVSDVTVGYECNIPTPAGLTVSSVTSSHPDAICAHNAALNFILLSVATPTSTPIVAGAHCNVSYTVEATAVDGAVYAIPATCQFFDVNTDPVAGSVSPGAITVQAAPPDVVLGFTPASAVAFPGGTSGTSTTASIAVSVASGSIGTGTVSNCVVGGTNASAFSVTAGVPATVPPAGTIDLSVTLANAALAATLTCDVADAGTATTHTWNLTAPAGTPVPAPGYSSNPLPGAAINRTGTPGSSCNSSVVITNNGFAGAGSDLTYNCSVAGADFTIASGASGTVAVGSSATVSVAVACPADGTSVTDTLTCTSNDPAVSTATYALSANGQAFVAPTFVPASSLWSKLALFGIFAALGMLVLGLRRNH